MWLIFGGISLEMFNYKCRCLSVLFIINIFSKVNNSKKKMINFEQSHINSKEQDHHDSFGFGKTSKKRTKNVYEKCAFQCVNLTIGLSQQQANCIKACYSKEFNSIGFKDAKLYL